MKSLCFLGLMAVAAVELCGQSQPPTTGAQFWSTLAPTCSGFTGNSFVRLTGPVAIVNSSGATIGASCLASGTFPWLAAGGSWSTTLRVAAPGSGAIGVDYTFYDQAGNTLSLDTTSGNGAASGNDLNFTLSANQPSEVRLLGTPSEAPQYTTTQMGSVYAEFFCPDVITCELALPQLLYRNSAVGSQWSLSVPIAWDHFFSELQPQGVTTKWSAVGVNDATHFLALAIYNQSNVASIYTVSVYDSNGSLVGQSTTPPIATNPATFEGGTLGVLLSALIPATLPSGVLKVVVDGGSNSSSVSVLQFDGAAAASLQVGFDSGPSVGAFARPEQTPNANRAR